MQRVKSAMKNERAPLFKQFLSAIFKEWNSVYYYESGSPSIRFARLANGEVMITDEVDKIEFLADETALTTLHTLLKNDKKIQTAKKNSQSISSLLEESFSSGSYDLINEKPYLVYDIETTFEVDDLKSQKFVMAYFIDSRDKKYRYVAEQSLEKFVKLMLEFDGYIVWYNHIFFDNPVVIYNLWLSDAEIETLNKKSIDVFLFLWNLTGKRIGLGKAWWALLGFGKTLESGAEGANLIKEYQKTHDEAVLKKVQLYCKNDVKLTLYLMLYLLHYQKVFIDGEECSFDLDQFMNFSSDTDKNKEINEQSLNQALF